MVKQVIAKKMFLVKMFWQMYFPLKTYFGEKIFFVIFFYSYIAFLLVCLYVCLVLFCFVLFCFVLFLFVCLLVTLSVWLYV